MGEVYPISVLAVDDEDLVREFIVAALEADGYVVLEASSARQAFEALETKAAGLGALVTDVNLGRGEPTGWDVARRARELNAALPIVYITGDSAAAWAAQRAPRSALVQKPFHSADLVAALRSVRRAE